MLTKRELDEMKAALKVAQNAYERAYCRCNTAESYELRNSKAAWVTHKAAGLINAIEDYVNATEGRSE
jgi:hypothetical protein